MNDRRKVWVCGACGRIGDTRESVGDESCYMWAVLCWEDSVLRDQSGQVRGATAVTEGKR